MLIPTVLPSGFVLAERHSLDAGQGILADISVYRHPSGGALAFASGSPGGIAGIGTGQLVTIRGHEAEIFHEAALDELAVTWPEATAYEPCHTYSISASGLELAEFIEVLAGVK